MSAGKVLVANLGSTSFKFRLFEMDTESQIARGGIDRIGSPTSQVEIECAGQTSTFEATIPDHAAAVQICFDSLTDADSGCLQSIDEVVGIGFKAVFAGDLSGVRRVDENLLATMEDLSEIAPAHNPPYVRAMRSLQEAFPDLPLVAALETGFHETIPLENRLYAVPYEWAADYQVRRWGFHGASHRYISQRIAEKLQRDDLKVISCHLGGSSSICATKGGQSFATSMGMSPQTGLPHNNRVGDFDPFALPLVLKKSGKTLQELLTEMSSQGGLLGLSGLSSDVRDLEKAASEGHERAKLALDHLVSSIRHYVGGYMALLGGLDVLVFTGGIGENSNFIRSEVCLEMEWAGLALDETANNSASGEAKISKNDSSVDVWTIPTNEELVVARQTLDNINQTAS
ncbi:acetate/propionate family kinase [Thalassoroseus pseudoceratinae]|uniref:acetate/propionate family kinase n=1 Tax=Thalassoroseus pseudoceratinae TaxID=2713176 RepID=UPI001423E645|nr:acetate/propionate family kinase [Thalassoroseus pseudoceratinae]